MSDQCESVRVRAEDKVDELSKEMTDHQIQCAKNWARNDARLEDIDRWIKILFGSVIVLTLVELFGLDNVVRMWIETLA